MMLRKGIGDITELLPLTQLSTQNDLGKQKTALNEVLWENKLQK